MKWSFVLSSFVVSMLSVNAFALDTNAAQIISQKEWTTGNIKGSFKDAALDPKNIESVMLHQLDIKNRKELSGKVDGNDSFVDVRLHGGYLRLQTSDDEYAVFADPDIQISNDTNVERVYKINSKLCIYDYDFELNETKELGCYYYENVLKLSSHQDAFFDYGLRGDFQYEKNNSYAAKLSVDVNVDNNATVVSSNLPMFIFPNNPLKMSDTLSANVYPGNLQTNK